MLRLKVAATASGRQLATVGRTSRAFSVARSLCQEQKQQEPEASTTEQESQEQPKKSHRLRNFLLFTGTVGLVAYGGGVFYAMKNDNFHDFFTEYVPFSEQVVAWVEERKFRSRFASKLSLPEFHKHENQENDKIVKVGNQGASAKEVDSAALPHVSALKDTTGAPEKTKVTAGNGTPLVKPSSDKKKQQQQEEGATTTKKDQKKALPLVHLPTDSDPLVADSIESLNNFIHAVNSSSPSEDAIVGISKDLTELSQKIHKLRSGHQEELKKSLEDQASRLASLGETRNEELKKTIAQQEEQLAQQFHSEQQRILDLYNQRLVTEIEATKKVVLAHANNKLLAVNAERERQFAQEISKRVEEEREGRLANIEKLAAKLESLQNLSLEADQIIEQSQNSAKLQSALTMLAHELDTAKQPTPLGFYLNRVRDAASGNDLIAAALESIPETVWTQGVLTKAQLAARLKLLEPEIRKASLLPPNAGIAGHMGSWLFSTFMWKKAGAPEGNDVESILARAETAMGEGRVTDAVSEINQLNGWPKKLAHDWLCEGRKRSEVEFLVDVLNEEGKLQSLK